MNQPVRNYCAKLFKGETLIEEMIIQARSMSQALTVSSVMLGGVLNEATHCEVTAL